MSITAEKKLTGWMVLSTVHKGYLVTRKYQGYTIKEAKEMFKEELKG